MASCEGHFYPDLMTIFTSVDQFILKNDWNDRYISHGKLPNQNISLANLTAMIIWVHEYVHFMQFNTRCHGTDYYCYSGSLANKSIKTAKKLLESNENNGFFLPLHYHAFNFYKKREDWPHFLESWVEYWINVNTILTVSGWSYRPTQDDFLHNHFLEKYHDKMYPKYIRTGTSPSCPVKEDDITTEMVYEIEAILLTISFACSFYPEKAQEVIENVYPQVDANLNFALNIREDGIDTLIPFLCDFTFQISQFHNTNESRNSDQSFQDVFWSDYRDNHPAWRFKHCLDVCESYAGIKPVEIEKFSKEIIDKLEKQIGPTGSEEKIKHLANDLTHCKYSVLGGPISKILGHNLSVRADNPNWFQNPLWFWFHIMSSLRTPIVKNFHAGVPVDAAYISSRGFGPQVLSPDEMVGLDVYTKAIWAGREIAKTQGQFQCPVCIFDHGLDGGGCLRKCNFSIWVGNHIGFHPLDHWHEIGE